MFRYSRDVKRCGPGTKAGAPVGVVYCLSTSSLFILMLALELNVSAFGIGDGLSNMLAEFNAGCQYEPLGSSLQAGSSQNHELGLGGHARAQFFRVAAEPLCPPPTGGRHRGLRLFWTRWPPALQQSSRASDQE